MSEDRKEFCIGTMSITPVCRANRGELGAFDAAVDVLRQFYSNLMPRSPASRVFLLSLSVQRPDPEEVGGPSAVKATCATDGSQKTDGERT